MNDTHPERVTHPKMKEAAISPAYHWTIISVKQRQASEGAVEENNNNMSIQFYQAISLLRLQGTQLHSCSAPLSKNKRHLKLSHSEAVRQARDGT